VGEKPLGVLGIANERRGVATKKESRRREREEMRKERGKTSNPLVFPICHKQLGIKVR